MADIQGTIQQIIAERDAAKKVLDTSYDEIADDKQDIIDGAVGSLTPDELAKVQALDAAMDKVAKANTALDAATVAALNQSTQVKALADSLDTVNKDLKAQETALAGVASAITSIGNAVKQVDGVLKTVLALVALFGG